MSTFLNIWLLIFCEPPPSAITTPTKRNFSYRYKFTQKIIATLDDYVNFASGAYEENLDTIISIEASVHKNILPLAKEYANTNYALLSFKDIDHNSIQLWPSIKSVQAHILHGFNPTAGLPESYEHYHITFGKDVYIGDADIDYILQWINAKTINIGGGNVIAYELSMRIDEMAALEYLENLELSVDSMTHGSLMVQPFLNILPALKMITFNVSELSDAEVETFLANQAGLKPSSHADHVIVYEN